MSLTKDLAPRLAPGYRFVPTGGGFYGVLCPDGKELRHENGKPYHCADNSGYHIRRRQESILRQLGAIPQPHLRQAKQDARPRQPKAKVGEHTNPVLLAQEILRDPRATPRERRMARAFLQAHENNLKVRGLAAQLGQRLRAHAS